MDTALQAVLGAIIVSLMMAMTFNAKAAPNTFGLEFAQWHGDGEGWRHDGFDRDPRWGRDRDDPWARHREWERWHGRDGWEDHRWYR